MINVAPKKSQITRQFLKSGNSYDRLSEKINNFKETKTPKKKGFVGFESHCIASDYTKIQKPLYSCT